MHRAPLLQALAEYAARHPAETATSGRFTEFVRVHADCFQRELAIGHVTGSAWIVNATGDAVLLTHHRKLDRWLQPGGHADGDADSLAVALREAVEETGLEPLRPVTSAIFDLDIHLIPARGETPAHEHFDVRYAIRHEGDGRFAVSEESHDLAWVPIDRLADYTAEESMHRMARKWLVGAAGDFRSKWV
jgi:8-oxo-dGTP pyrophosphatase MutT (NUDIX family)